MTKQNRTSKITQRIVNLIYPITILELFSITVCLPLMLSLYFLKINLVTLFIIWLTMCVLGPMVTTVFHTLQLYIDNQEPGLFMQAWHFLRRNWRESFLLWLPLWLLILPTMLYTQMDISNESRLLLILIPATVIIDLIALLLTINVLLIAGIFKFKYADYWRLAIGSLTKFPLMTLANLILILIAIAIGIWFHPLVDILLITCLLIPCYYLNLPTISWIKNKFIN